MSDEIRTCASCKHFKGPENLYVAHMQLPNRDSPTCEHPKAASRDMIYGKAFCVTERQTQKGCGKKGRLWDSKG
jgi:hypothetical protein